jgi:hypothetical protein
MATWESFDAGVFVRAVSRYVKAYRKYQALCFKRVQVGEKWAWLEDTPYWTGDTHDASWARGAQRARRECERLWALVDSAHSQDRCGVLAPAPHEGGHGPATRAEYVKRVRRMAQRVRLGAPRTGRVGCW